MYYAYVVGVFDIYKVEAAHGGDAVEKLCEALQVKEWEVYLISEEEALEWEKKEIRIRGIV